MMKNKVFLKSICIVLIIILSCFFASANSLIDSSQSVKLNLSISDSDNAFAQTQIEIYKVASINADYTFEVAADFSSYQVDISQNSSNYYALSQTLSSYIALDNLEPTITMMTDENSALSLQDLPWGLYLIQFSSVINNGQLHSILPTLVALPYQNEDNSFDYEVDIIAKSTVYSSMFLSSLSSKTVIKYWDDAQYESARPESITVALLKDGEIYDTAQLSESNSWQFTWLSLDNYSNWQVAELDVDESYTVLSECESFVFELTNTFKESTQETIPTTTQQTTAETTTKTTTQSTTQSTSTQNDEIPKTGTSLWLIPVFSSLGVCSILGGVYLKRKSQGELDE